MLRMENAQLSSEVLSLREGLSRHERHHSHRPSPRTSPQVRYPSPVIHHQLVHVLTWGQQPTAAVAQLAAELDGARAELDSVRAELHASRAALSDEQAVRLGLRDELTAASAEIASLRDAVRPCCCCGGAVHVEDGLLMAAGQVAASAADGTHMGRAQVLRMSGDLSAARSQLAEERQVRHALSAQLSATLQALETLQATVRRPRAWSCLACC
jgi:septal ring factor EnvC (AmiA/AmiB activator)